MAKRAKKPKSVLRLPDLDYSKSAVLNSLPSLNSRRSYEHAIRDFIEWYCSEPRLAFNKTVVTRYRIALKQRRYAPSTINLRLAAVRRLAFEASDCGLLSPDLAAGIRRVKGAKRLGVRVGNWLTVEQGKKLLDVYRGMQLRDVRNHAVLAMLLGCGLRKAELVAVKIDDFELREEHWVLADLVGKGRHMRTIPVPDWVKSAVDAWLDAAGLQDGTLFRAIDKTGKVHGCGFTAKVIWSIVREAAKDCGIGVIAPHDLRRTCARLCHQAGGELEQIQFLLGHVSVQTTERYLGCKQRLHNAVNDRIGLEPISPSGAWHAVLIALSTHFVSFCPVHQGTGSEPQVALRMAHSDFSISISETAVDVSYTPSNSEPRGKLFGLIFTISMLVLMACGVLFLPGKHGNPSMWHDLTSDPPASLLLFILVVIVPLIGLFSWQGFRYARAAWASDETFHCDREGINIKRIPWLDFSNRTWRMYTYPLSEVSAIRFAVIASAKGRAFWGLRFRAHGRKWALPGLEAPEAKEILTGLKALGADVPEDPKLDKRIKETLETRFGDTSWMDRSWMDSNKQ